MDSDSWIVLISIVLLIACSAFFSGSETAISRFNKLRMKKKSEDGDKSAKLVMQIWDNEDKSFTAILVGNSIVNVTAASLGTVIAIEAWGTVKGAAIATVAVALLVLVFGEIMPKAFTKENPDLFALRLAKPLTFTIKFLSPLSFVITKLTYLLRGAKKSEQAPSITEEELIYMMDAIEEEGVLEEQERDLVQSALEFDEISIHEILTPRVNIVAVDVESTLDEVHKIIVEEGFSRIPVYEKSIDNIIGVLYSRDVLLGVISGKPMKIRGMLGQALFVHKGMRLSHLLTSFKARKLNLAIVVDEYGGTLGIVTMEDVLEELVGEIWDEDDEIPSDFLAIDDNHFEAMGNLDLQEMFESLGLDVEAADSDYSTIGGWALHELEHIPKIGEEFDYENYRFTVLDMDGHRLKKLGIVRQTTTITDASEDTNESV